MSDWNTMEEYLVRIGADIDQNSFGAARSALTELKSHLVKLKGAAAPLALATAIGAIGKAAYETVKGVAKADMEYQKLAASMWTTKETAKALSVAMKTMGVSQDDIAWVPELREQFFRLRGEMQKFATPADADAQLRYIREIGYDVQVLFVRLKMLKEWIAYYLIKYLEPYIEDFRAFLNWLLDKLGTDMPGLARTVARAMSMVLQPALATIKALGLAIGKVYDFIVSLPDNVKKWGAVFAAVGAIIMAGPFGALLAGLSMAMILIEDFVGYMNGWNSSATLAPIWEALLKFSEGTGSEWMQNFKQVLKDIADILDDVFNGMNLNGLLEEASKNMGKLGKGASSLFESLKKIFTEMDKGKPKVKDFWKVFGDAIGTVLRFMFRLIGALGDVMDAVSSYLDGDKKEGLKKMRRAWGTLTGNEEVAGFDGVGTSMEESKKYFTANEGVPLDTLAPEARAGFAALMKDIHTSTGGQQTWLTATTNGKHMEGSDHYKGIAIDLVNDAFQDEAFRKAYIKKIEALGYHVYDEYDRANWTGDTTGEHLHIRLDGYKAPELKKSKYDMDFGIKPKGSTEVNGDVTNRIAGEMLQSGFMPGEQEMATAPLQNAMPNAQESATGNNASMSGLFSGIGLKTGFMPGEQEMATAPIRDSYADALLRGELNPAWAGGTFGGGGADSGNYNFGGSTVNIYVRSTSATPQEIGSAAKSGVEQGMNETLHIMQRFGRRAEV